MTTPLPNRSNPRGKRRWLPAFILVLLLAAMFTAYLVFSSVRQAVAAWDGGRLGSLVLRPGPTPTQIPWETSIPDPAGDTQLLPTPDPWNGASPVTILILGLDYRDWQAQEGPPRSDTMILLTVDPVSKTAGMLSIPRDLWVNIPGMGYNKINTAMRFGELYKLPGGGPGNTKVLKPGMHHMNGQTALAYARNRSTALDDTDRSHRQHQVIFGKSPDGLDIDMPIMSKIHLLRDQIFMTSGAASRATADLPIQKQVQEEKAAVALVNAAETGDTSLQDQTAQFLESNGIQLAQTEQGKQAASTTRLIDHSGKPYTLKYLVKLMDLPDNAIYSK